MIHNPYYTKKLQEGLEYQDFVAVEFSKIGIAITSFSSKKYQYKKGENLQGYEIKNDQKFRQTGNLWIEVEERLDPNGVYCPSGIFRSDNTIFYFMGDYQGGYLMQKNVLKAIAEKREIVENKRKSSKGFLLQCREAEKLFNYVKFTE